MKIYKECVKYFCCVNLFLSSILIHIFIYFVYIIFNFFLCIFLFHKFLLFQCSSSKSLITFGNIFTKSMLQVHSFLMLSPPLGTLQLELQFLLFFSELFQLCIKLTYFAVELFSLGLNLLLAVVYSCFIFVIASLNLLLKKTNFMQEICVFSPQFSVCYCKVKSLVFILLLSLPHFLLGVEGNDHGRSMRIPFKCFYFFLPLFLVSPQLLVLFDCFLNKLS